MVKWWLQRKNEKFHGKMQWSHELSIISNWRRFPFECFHQQKEQNGKESDQWDWTQKTAGKKN